MKNLFRPNIARMTGYQPGEQPQDQGWTKLNTNENPYPPSPKVVEAIIEAARGRLNLYPDPLGTRFRQVAAELFGVDPEWILPANGSDENLTLILRSFVDPHEQVAYPYPSYILYETLADLQGGDFRRLNLRSDWSWDLDRCRTQLESTKLLLIPNPNSPSGNLWSHADLLSLIPPSGVLVVDEAYGDFADVPHRGELLQRPGSEQIILTRSFSKSYSLAGVRLGFAVAHPDLIRGMRKVKDSYNCDSLSLAAGIAALQDQAWMQSNSDKVRQTRSRMTAALVQLGFDVVPSQANFVWATHGVHSSQSIYEQLKQRKILVRLMKFSGLDWTPDGTVSGLRISVGTDAEIDQLLAALRSLL